MSFGFRDKERPSLRDRLRGKSSDQIVEELRKKLDNDREMFFERVPNPSSFRRAGFPFDDDGLRARGRPDFRHRLEELAQQHPEFADSLRPWYDQQQQPQQPQQPQQSAPSPQPQQDMGWGFRQRTGSNSSQPQAQQEAQQEQQAPQQEPQQPGLAHHGLRNTVDIGEAQAQMDGQAQDERVKRAQSAPPAPDQVGPGAGQHPQAQRFVSRLDIHPQPASTDPAAAKPPSGSKQQQQQQPPPQPSKTAGGNVRQIPIFVEGRDEPVLAKDDVDSATNFGQSYPSRHGVRPDFGQSFSRSNMGFPSFHSRESCDQEAPAQKRPFPQQHQQPAPQRQPHQQQQPHYQQPPQHQQPHYQQPQHHQPHHQQQQPPRQQTPPQAQQQAQPQQAPPPPPPQKPKDALEKVREVQLEVESLSKQVDEFKGTRKDKHYLFLDEMLTRELIKLDVIETEGRDDVRAARKETIRSIQQCISRLESLADGEQAAAAPAPASAPASTESMEVDPASAAPSTESMEVDPSSQTSGDCKTEAQEAAAPAPSAEPAQPAAAPAPPVNMDTTPAAAAPVVQPAAAPESVQTAATTAAAPSPAQDSATPAEVPPAS